MRFRVEQVIEGARTDVEATLVDPEFVATLAGLPRTATPEVLEHHDDGDVVRRRVRHRFTASLPGAAQRMVDPDRLSWVEESVHSRSAHRTEARIVPDHYADWLTASFVATFDDDGPGRTRRLVAGEVSVHLPLVGRKVESAIVSGLEEHAAAEAAACSRWLGGPAR